MRLRPLWATLLLGLALFSCARLAGGSATASRLPATRLGGMTTTFEDSADAYSLSARNLSLYDDQRFADGGDVFEEIGCGTCHIKDGRGSAPKGDGPLPDEMVVFDGDGQRVEDEVQVTYSTVEGSYDDGTSYTLRRPSYTAVSASAAGQGTASALSPRIAPPLIGLGLLEQIDTESSGGRFGWRATQGSVDTQTETALAGDFDLTPDEVGLDRLYDLVLYTKGLAVPARRSIDDDAGRGAELFDEIGCVSCHTPDYTTGSAGPVRAFSDQAVWPYTDLEVHDLGDGLADRQADGSVADGGWRTPPLWGIGLAARVNPDAGYLHDGRARSLEEAILWHGGEAQDAHDRWLGLSQDDRDALLAFLAAL